MKRLTLYTTRYIKLIRERFNVLKTEKCGNGYALIFAWEGDADALARAVMALLEEAALRENPVYRHSPVMRTLAQELRKTPMYAAQWQALRRFLRGNRQLHMEGYIRFRMGKYCEGLDVLSYRLIKKLNLHAKKDWL